MKAIRPTENGASLVDMPMPESDVEAVVRVIRSGICSTDLEIIKGYADFRGTIGHEFVGVVERCESDASIIGKRVVGEINAGCGRCSLCMTGDPRHCPERTVLGIHGRDGCHAEYLTLPAANLYEVPDSVSDNESVFIEPLAAAWGITEQVEIASDTRVAVIGDGKLGILCAMSVGLLSKNVVLIGRHVSKLEIAKATDIECVLADDSNVLGRRFDVVVEASGSETGFEAALDLVRPRGKIVLKSTFHGKPSWPASRIVVDEITIVGSRCGRFGPAIELLANKKIAVAPLISEEFKLADGIKAFEHAEAKGVLKVILSMG